jgi:hypothetical protein
VKAYPGHHRRPRTFDVALIALVAWLCGLAIAPAANAQPSAEYRLKAVFIYHFTQFVDWPREAFIDRESPFVIGILGEDPFGDYLKEAVRDEKVHGRAIVVRHVTMSDSIDGVQILYVSPSERHRERQILERVKGRPILTVADTPGFAASGGAIQFFTDRGRIRLRVNVDSARGSSLNISSRLLGLADIYRGSGRG